MGDEQYGDYTPDAYPGQPLIGAAAQAAPPEWTPNDGLRLTRLNNSADALRQQADDGVLHPLEAQREIGKIEPQRQALRAKQAAAQDAELGAQAQAALHQSAVQKAVQLQDQKADHAAFQTWTDPDTGEKFFQHKPGEWTQVSPSQPSVEAEAPAEEAAAPQPELRANPDGTHTISIQNGAGNIVQTTYARDESSPTGFRTTGRQEIGPDGQPVQQAPSEAPGNPDGSLSDHQRQDIQQKAGRLVGPPPPQFWNGRPNPQYLEWMKRVQSTAGRMEQEQMSLNLARAKGQITSTENQRREGVQAAKAAAKIPTVHDLAKQFDFTPHDTMKMLKDEEDAIRKDETVTPPVLNPADGGHYAGPWNQAPKEAQHAEAVRRVMARLRSMKGDAVAPGGEAPAAAQPQAATAAASPAQPVAPQIKPLPKGAATEADIDAAIARKMREKQGPGLIPRLLSTPREPGFRQ